MADYKNMYTKLFNAITNVIEVLKAVQIETEEMYLEQEEPEIVLLDKPDNE